MRLRIDPMYVEGESLTSLTATEQVFVPGDLIENRKHKPRHGSSVPKGESNRFRGLHC